MFCYTREPWLTHLSCVQGHVSEVNLFFLCDQQRLISGNILGFKGQRVSLCGFHCQHYDSSCSLQNACCPCLCGCLTDEFGSSNRGSLDTGISRVESKSWLSTLSQLSVPMVGSLQHTAVQLHFGDGTSPF